MNSFRCKFHKSIDTIVEQLWKDSENKFPKSFGTRYHYLRWVCDKGRQPWKGTKVTLNIDITFYFNLTAKLERCFNIILLTIHSRKRRALVLGSCGRITDPLFYNGVPCLSKECGQFNSAVNVVNKFNLDS